MKDTVTPVAEIPAITRTEASRLAATENQRMLDVLRSLEGEDWSRPTDCTEWDVRALAAHVLGGLEAFASWREFIHQMRGASKRKGDAPFVDAMTALQVEERAALTTGELVERVAVAGPRNAQWRSKRRPLRAMPMKEEVGGQPETWKMSYLVDTILTRDTWMHRVDLTRATGREMVLTADHDGRLIADVVAEWARRHGRPFTLHVEGPAGGSYRQGDGDAPVTVDAVEFCRGLSGRAPATGLFAQEVPF
jgi:uncharacterized protein (TIGR03083 family)